MIKLAIIFTESDTEEIIAKAVFLLILLLLGSIAAWFGSYMAKRDMQDPEHRARMMETAKRRCEQ